MRKILFILLIVIAATSVAFGQTEMSHESKGKPQPVTNKMENTFSFNHLALSVKNVDRSADFYKRVLNLEEITNRTKIEGIRWFSLGDGKELYLISILKEKFKLNKAIHFAVAISDVDSFIKKLDSMKLPYSNWVGD